MFTRIVELTARPGKFARLSLTLNNNILPILENQSGFEDAMVLESGSDPGILLEISLWRSKADADLYHRTEFREVCDCIEDLIQGVPQVRVFALKQSTIRRLRIGKAA